MMPADLNAHRDPLGPGEWPWQPGADLGGAPRESAPVSPQDAVHARNCGPAPAVEVVRADGKLVYCLHFAHSVVELWPDCIVTRKAGGQAVPAAPQDGHTWASCAWHEIAHTLIAELTRDEPSACLGAGAWTADRHREETLAYALGRYCAAVSAAIAAAYPLKER